MANTSSGPIEGTSDSGTTGTSTLGNRCIRVVQMP